MKQVAKSKYLKYLFIFVFLFIFLLLLEGVLEKEIMMCDLWGYNFVNKYLRSDVATFIFKFITNFGDAPYIIAVALLATIFFKTKNIGIAIFANLGLCALLNQVLKFVIQRPRPSGYHYVLASGYSFPSGHSMVSMAFYGLLIYFIYKSDYDKTWKYLSMGLFGLLIFLIGLSRIYLGVHYVSDVLAGFVLSISYLFVFVSVMNSLEKKYEK